MPHSPGPGLGTIGPPRGRGTKPDTALQGPVVRTGQMGDIGILCLWRRGSEELPGAGTLELGFGGCEAEGQEEHSTWEEACVQGCEAAVSSVCLNDRPDDTCMAEVEGAKGGVTGCGEGPRFYPKSTREPRGSKEQERDQVRWAFFKSPLGNGS